MLIIKDYCTLSDSELEQLCQRNTDDDGTIDTAVKEILAAVKQGGDKALAEYTRRFDGVNPGRLFLDALQLETLASQVLPAQQEAIRTAFNNIREFHSLQLQPESHVETMPGVVCWREPRPIERVGLYIPGGSAVLPSTFLMLGVPATIAGCKEIVVCSPPGADGSVNKYLAFVACLLGIPRIYLAGGAQAIAAMAYGTQSIPKVDKIFGPGNQYVTRAKTLVQSLAGTAIDMPAGPSEVLVIADESANPAFVAADLLAQAEHGADSQSILVSDSAGLIEKVNRELEHQLQALPRKELAAAALGQSYALQTESLDQALAFSNRYAPEHLILSVNSWQSLAAGIVNAGSVFTGHLCPESAGDYASGTNHTLPTSGYARAYSGVSVDSFVKKITFQNISKQGLKLIGPIVETLAGLEGLQAHKNAVSIRLSTI